jgi:hypothetical protein
MTVNPGVLLLNAKQVHYYCSNPATTIIFIPHMAVLKEKSVKACHYYAGKEGTKYAAKYYMLIKYIRFISRYRTPVQT